MLALYLTYTSSLSIKSETVTEVSLGINSFAASKLRDTTEAVGELILNNLSGVYTARRRSPTR
jgi:hypothetical protein